MTAALRTEWEKLLRRPALHWSLMAAALMSTLFGYVIPYLVTAGFAEPAQGPSDERGFAVPLSLLFPGGLVDNAIGGFPLFYLALALVLGSLSAGSEYEWRTIRPLLTAGPRRSLIVTAKSVVLLGSLLLVALVAFAASWVASMVVAGIEQGPLQPPPAGEVLMGIGAAWIILAVGGALGVFGGILAGGSGPVIGIGLVYLFVVETLLRSFATGLGWLEAVTEVLPGTNAGSLAGAIAGTSGAPGVNELVAAPQAVGALVGWLLLAGFGTAVLFTRRDVTT